MKATLLQTDFSKGLALTNRAISTRGQLPVLANVLIEAKKDGVTLSATNLEVGIRVNVGGKVIEEGSLTIPARNLAEFVSSIAANNVDLNTDGEKLSIKSGKFAATFAGIAASEFPVMPVSNPDNSQRLDSSLVGEIATQVAYAAASDESRPVLTGIKFHLIDGHLVATATDGFRLSRKVLTKGGADLSAIIMPAKTLTELAKISTETGEKDIEMEIVKENNQVIFTSGSVQIISRVLEGNFPDTEKIVPKDFKTEILIDKQELVRALRAMAIFARDSNNIVKLKIDKDVCKISARAAQQGEGETEVEVEMTGEGGEIAFNYKYIMDFLGSLETERVGFKMNDSLSPGVFFPEKESTLLHLIMPVRI